MSVLVLWSVLVPLGVGLLINNHISVIFDMDDYCIMKYYTYHSFFNNFIID